MNRIWIGIKAEKFLSSSFVVIIVGSLAIGAWLSALMLSAYFWILFSEIGHNRLLQKRNEEIKYTLKNVTLENRALRNQRLEQDFRLKRQFKLIQEFRPDRPDEGEEI